MTKVRTDIAIVGGGPSGLSAAIAAAEAGASVDILDVYAAPGGQYWMPPSAEGSAAVMRAKRAGVRFYQNAEIWAIFPGHRICATRVGEPLEISAKSIIIATGAYDRVAPFPGWTLPGVVTCGAAARLAKFDGLPIGRRVVIAGSGLFMLAVKKAVETAGGSVAAFIEAQSIGPQLLTHIARHPDRWYEVLDSLRSLGARRMRRRFGWIVTEARGDNRVEEVRIARNIAGSGSADCTETISGIDALIIGFGLMPSIELSALLRCRHDYDESRGGWFCVSDDETGRTSVDGVYAAGEVTGIAGSRAAQISGSLAGAAAAADLGFSAVKADRHGSSLRRLRSARAYAYGVNRLFSAPGMLDAIPTDETIICRCEEVTYSEVRSTGPDGARTVPGVKRYTRAGMGPCQGRMCGWAVARASADGDLAKTGFNRPRIPIRPVPLAVVAETLESEPG